ncbi:hypothetical protein SERLA73DRAFT_24846, partial [Serpula lacrymans var. lacrymans S7.3]
RKRAEKSLQKAAEQMKKQYDKKKREAVEYRAGDKVYVEATNISTDRPAKKLDDKRHGPFEILEKIGESAYKLALPPTWRPIHPVFNEIKLTPYREAQFPSQQKPKPIPPVIVDGQEEYEVEEVLDSRLKRGKLEYLVHWKNYPKEERTWEPKQHLNNSPDK